MQNAATELQTTKKRHSFALGVSGNISGSRVPRGLNELVEELATDFAGVTLSAIDKALLRSAALLLLRGSRTADPDGAVRSVSEARRILQDLKRRHPVDAKPAGLSLYERLEREAAQRASSDAAACADAAEATGAPANDDRAGEPLGAAEAQREDGYGRPLDQEEGEP
jgi:hypothetical protein